MNKISTKILIIISLITTVLLTLSPILILIEHHSLFDVIDKVILSLNAFSIVFINLIFQRKIQSKSFSNYKITLLIVLLNIGLFIINIFIRKPIWEIIPFHKPPLTVIILTDFVRQFIIATITSLTLYFFSKNEKLNENKNRLNELENQKLQLHIKNLTAQIQPHFFFNSLNVLSELIHTDTQKSDQYIQHLSNVFRYVLSYQEEPFITLTDEFNFIKSYLFLFKIRFEDEITTLYEITGEENYLIPSLCSIVVLENIFKHNNVNNIKIYISISKTRQMLSISNSKNKKNDLLVESIGLGLANIDKKCYLLLNQNIKITETDDLFVVEIPLKQLT